MKDRTERKNPSKKRPGGKSRQDKPDKGPPEIPDLRLAGENALRGMSDLFGGDSKGGRAFKAQELAYAAMEAPSDEQALELATRAVVLDPTCVDALVIAANLGSGNLSELISNMRAIVDIGRKKLGPKFFKENAGDFWGILKTRPYMRAHAYLAELLVAAGCPSEAIQEYEELLRLNPNDNQGLRYAMLGLCLSCGLLDKVRLLFKQYEEEWSAMFAWGKVLERFLSHDEEAAKALLQEAHERNKHVLPYLTGQKKMPRRLPAYYGIGDKNEAIVCADCLGKAWRKHPGAREWLIRATAA